MRHRLSVFCALVFLFLLSACGNGEVNVTYELQFDTLQPGEQAKLTMTSLKVAERRMKGIGEHLLEKDFFTEDGMTYLSLTLPTQDIANLLTTQLTAPFNLQIMREVPTKEADEVVEGHGGFAKTGLNEEHLLNVEAGEDSTNPGKGRVQLFFTEEGRDLMRNIFQENLGKNIGVFVRGKLVSKLQVESEELKDDILIRDIPNRELAQIFADDVNVGLHVIFVPQDN